MNNNLQHHGILGMRWGVRRYRNKDGSLTAAGKRKAKKAASEDANRATEIKRKKVKQMSNTELRTINERKQLETQYSNLNPNHIKKGFQFAAGAAAVTTTALTLYGNVDKIRKIVKK